MAIPRLCCSHTVATAAKIRVVNGAGTGATATLAAGTYWTDPNLSGLSVANDLLYALGEAVKSALSLATMAVTYDATDEYWFATFAASAEFKFDATHAETNAEGDRVLRRLGINLVAAEPATAAATVVAGMVQGIWAPSNRGESGFRHESSSGDAGGVVVASDGTAYSTFISTPAKRRTLVFAGLPGSDVVSTPLKYTGANASDATFENVMVPWIQRGEQLRYYEDSSGTYTCLSTAVSQGDAAATVKSETGFAQNGVITIDGERCFLSSAGSGTTWNLHRILPVAHAAGAPVGVGKWVATYLVDTEGGNCNRKQFAPDRVAYNQDRWNLEIPLVRATP